METNLLSHSRANEADVDRSRVKIAALGIVGTGAALLSGYLLSLFTLAATRQHFLLFSAAVTAFLVVILLQAFFVKSFSKVFFLSSVYVSALLVPLYATLSPLALLGAGAAVACLLWGYERGTHELKDRVKIRFFRVSRLTLGKAAIGLSIFLALYYFGIQPGDTLVSKSLFEQLVLPGAGLTERVIPGVSLRGTFGHTLETLALRQVEAAPGFKLLPAAAQRALLSAATMELEGRAAELLGIVPEKNQRLVDVLYEALLARMSGLSGSVRQLTLFVIGALAFFAIRGVAVFAVWGALAFGFVIYEILVALGFATVVLESGSREIIII